MVRDTSHRWSPAFRRAFPLALVMAGAAVAAGWQLADGSVDMTRAAAPIDSEQGTPDPWGCVTRTPTRTPTATPTSYRVYDASAQIAVSAPRVAPGETFQVMARGASPFGYRLSSSQLDGIRLTGVFTYTRSGQSQPDACIVTPAGFTCRDDHLIGHGNVTIYLDAIAGLPAEQRTVCTRIDSPPPYGTGHDLNPSNNSDCVSFTVVPAATAPAATATPTTARLRADRRMPPVDQPGTATTEPTATRTETPAPTGTGSPTRTVTSTPTPTIGLCDPPTATFTPTPTPTSIRMFDASVEAWSNAPRVPAGRTVRLVVHGDLSMKWRLDGTIEGSEGLRLTGAYTFTQLTSHPARRCVVEPRGFWCALDTPDDVYVSTDEELFFDALVDPGTSPGSASLCVVVGITAPRGSGGDPNGANNRACAGIGIVPAAADTPTPTAVVPLTDTPTPIVTPTAATSPPPERARLWLPFASGG